MYNNKKLMIQAGFVAFLAIGTVYLIQEKNWAIWWIIVPLIGAAAVIGE